MNKQKGFTLIELMVAVVIILLVLGVAFGLFGKDGLCYNGLKHVYTAQGFEPLILNGSMVPCEDSPPVVPSIEREFEAVIDTEVDSGYNEFSRVGR